MFPFDVWITKNYSQNYLSCIHNIKGRVHCRMTELLNLASVLRPRGNKGVSSIRAQRGLIKNRFYT